MDIRQLASMQVSGSTSSTEVHGRTPPLQYELPYGNAVFYNPACYGQRRELNGHPELGKSVLTAALAWAGTAPPRSARSGSSRTRRLEPMVTVATGIWRARPAGALAGDREHADSLIRRAPKPGPA